jgi:hypothetical protein
MMKMMMIETNLFHPHLVEDLGQHIHEDPDLLIHTLLIAGDLQRDGVHLQSKQRRKNRQSL